MLLFYLRDHSFWLVRRFLSCRGRLTIRPRSSHHLSRLIKKESTFLISFFTLLLLAHRKRGCKVNTVKKIEMLWCFSLLFLLTRIFHTKSITACGKLYGYCVGLELWFGPYGHIQPGIIILHPPCTHKLCTAPHDDSVWNMRSNRYFRDFIFYILCFLIPLLDSSLSSYSSLCSTSNDG